MNAAPYISYIIILYCVSFCWVDKNFNLNHNFQTRSDRAFILHMYIPCDKTFHMVP